MKEIRIGLLGFGTVGAGVVDGLVRHGELVNHRAGCTITLAKIADLDIESDRGVAVDRLLLTDDARSVIDDPDIDIIVELIGGTEAAREFIMRALEQGKTVVTANKALLAEHGRELFDAAEVHRTDLLYEASVAGGIPVIRALREGLIANHIEGIYGILNGTCNYILTRMERENLPFEQVLEQAQREGYAEADPSLDVDGLDTAHKAVILTFLAYGFHVSMRDIEIAGIRRITGADIRYARQLGFRIKLLAGIRHADGQVEVTVAPALVPESHMLASVQGVNNAVLVRGDITGDTLYYGRGAGRYPTAGAVIADIAEAARNLATDSAARIPAFTPLTHYGKLKPAEEVASRYYLRILLLNCPGVLAKVAHILGEYGISIASVIQDEHARHGEHVDVIVLTQRAPNRSFDLACAAIDALDETGAETLRLRVESFE